MKKFFGLISAALLCLSLTACGSEPNYSSFQQDKLADAEARSVLYVVPTLQKFMNGSQEELGEFLNGEFKPELISEFTNEEMKYGASQTFNFNADGYGFKNAISNFCSGYDEVGEITIPEAIDQEVNYLQWSLLPEETQDYYVSMGYVPPADPGTDLVKSTVKGNEIFVNFDVVGEKREASVEIIYTNDMFVTLKSAALNPKYSFAEKMEKAGLNTVIGMGTVFVMLILISFIISLFGVFSGQGRKKSKVEKGIDKAVAQIESSESAELAGDSQLVAVIAAAIAAYEGSGSADGYVVRSIRKIKR